MLPRFAILILVWLGLWLFVLVVTTPYAIGASGNLLAYVEAHPERPADPEARARWQAIAYAEWLGEQRARAMRQKIPLTVAAATLTAMIALGPLFLRLGPLRSRRRTAIWFCVAAAAGGLAAALPAVSAMVNFLNSMTEHTAPFIRGAIASVPIAAGIGLVVGAVTAGLLEAGRRIPFVSIAVLTIMWVTALQTVFAARVGALGSMHDLREGLLVDLLHNGPLLVLASGMGALACRARGRVNWRIAAGLLLVLGSGVAVVTFAMTGNVDGWYRIVPGAAGVAATWVALAVWNLAGPRGRVPAAT